MTSSARSDPLELLLIDGDNLLHDVRGTRDEGGVAWLLPRLLGWRPAELRIVVALDGHPASGALKRTRVSRGIEFLHSGSASADDLLVALLRAQPYAGRARTAVVTGDGRLRDRVRRAGGLVRSVDWLMRQLAGGAEPPGRTADGSPVGIGQGAPPRRRHFEPADPDGVEPSGWEPGRGATRKKGNPRRAPRRAKRR